MKRILKWLESKFSQRSAAIEADEPHTPVRVKPKDIAEEVYSVEIAFDSNRTPTVPTLTTLEESSFEVEESSLEVIESAGFDPYNSGSFDTPKSPSRK